ncbi:MAG: GntR family transcriptional regulator [Lachnospiraceae bacterium]|nr:GntR family transcriptional regulator [Lachnospiraceae bacterium]
MSDFKIDENSIKKINQMLRENPFRPLNKILYDALYQYILDGKLTPDQQLIESKIAASLGISRSPVRIALQELISNGILVKEDGAIHVKSINYPDTLMLYEARMAIEPQAARIVANRITDDELSSLKNLVDKFVEVDRTGDEHEYVLADTKFHRLIFSYTKNPYLIEIYHNLEFPLACYRNQVKHLNYDNMTKYLGIERGSYHHAHIYEMLKLHAPLLAEEAMKNDIVRMYATLSCIEW